MKNGDQKVCLIRVDGSKRLGMGHIMRTLAVADGFQDAGFSLVFVTRDTDDGALHRLNSTGHPVEKLPPDWPFSEDLKFTERCIQSYGAGVMVTDLCNNDTLVLLDEYEDYLRKLKQLGVRLVTIDDQNCFPFASDFVVNPNYGAETLPYQPSDGTVYLLGPDYFLFRRELLDAAGQPREVRQAANRVLVTLGGGEPGGLLKTVLTALLQIKNDPPLEVRLGLGLEDASQGEVADLVDRFQGRCRLFDADCNMAKLMLWSDVAITAGGLTKYETALTGTPSLIFSRVDQQHQLMLKFSSKDTCVYLGLETELKEDGIRVELEALLRDYDRRLAMSRTGKALMDGRGVERVLEVVGGQGAMKEDQ